MPDHEIFELGNAVLQSGATLRGAKLAYKTYGALNSAKDNVIVYPTFFGGQHIQNEAIIKEGMALDPSKYFIIVPNMFGNGLSSSPSNTPTPYDRARFPSVTVYDNVICQHRLVTELFGIERIALVTGWSMGRSRPTSGDACSQTWSSASCRYAARPKRPGTTSFSLKV